MSKQRPGIAVAMCVLWLVAGYRAFVRPWIHSWGARAQELAADMPGDQMCSGRSPRTTRAITIATSVDAVWPWLAQIGEGRGGFYSYSLLERAVGADIHNAKSIHPPWQELHTGDTIWLAKRYGPAARQIVADVRAGSYLVLVSPKDFARLSRGEKATGTWSFLLADDPGGCRLVVRGSGGAVGHFWFDVPHFIMEQKMMRGIRTRALGSLAGTASQTDRSGTTAAAPAS